jgi:hypothetical protein
MTSPVARKLGYKTWHAGVIAGEAPPHPAYQKQFQFTGSLELELARNVTALMPPVGL